MKRGFARGCRAIVSVCVALGMSSVRTDAQPRYDAGASDGTIKIGNVAASSGPLSIYRPYGEALSRCFDKINADGGINKRKIQLIAYDDAYSPPKTVEQARKVVEILLVPGNIQPICVFQLSIQCRIEMFA